MYYKCNEEMHRVCSNSALCHLCDGKRLFKDPVAEQKAKQEAKMQRKEDIKNAPLKTYQKEKKEGMAFEKRVAQKWNDRLGGGKQKKLGKPRLDLQEPPPSSPPPRIMDEGQLLPPPKPKPLQPRSLGQGFPKQEAKRQPNSGAGWAAKGDIKLDHALMECKERGTVTSKGAKQIAIQKEWLDKMVIEAFKENRDYWYLPFGFKGDDDIYLVKPYDHEMQLIIELRQAQERIRFLENQINQQKESE